MIRSKIPTPEEIVVLPPPLLGTAIKLGKALKDIHAKWALGGDAGEVMLGVNVESDHLEILTTKPGTEEIASKLNEYQAVAPEEREKTLAREAEIDGGRYPVFVKSPYAEFTINGTLVEVYGDLQLKVGEWEWGDPLDYEPTVVSVVGTSLPVVPLRLKSELDLGLGWLDRVKLISDAVMRSQHRH